MSPYPIPLRDGVLIRRYKRFLADVAWPDGTEETVHCPNPGAMTGLAVPGTPVLLSHHPGKRRKLPWSWELAQIDQTLVCINTTVANRVVGQWLKTGQLLPELGPARAEVRCGESRIDFGFVGGHLLEVKSVTLLGPDGIAAFPDAKTDRGRRHVETLTDISGARRILLYFVARSDARAVRPADEIDPAYGKALRKAHEAGVEIMALRADFTRDGVKRGPFLDVLWESGYKR